MNRNEPPAPRMATEPMARCRARALGGALLLSGLMALAQLPTAGSALALADQRDTQALFSALNDLMQFAAPGRSITWDNPATGNKGEVEALRRNDAIGRTCWDYERTYPDGGRVMGVSGTACEVTSGLWEIVEEGTPFQVGGSTTAKASTPKAAATSSKPSYDRAMVRETQALLTELGYKPGPVDGAYGRKTGGAISTYQRDKGKTVNGKPSQALLTDLRGDVRSKVATQTQTPSQGTTQTPPAQTQGGQTPGTQQPAQEPESLPWLKPSIPDETRPAGSGNTAAETESPAVTPTPTPTPSATTSTAPASTTSTTPTTTSSGSSSESDAGVWVPPPPPAPPAE